MNKPSLELANGSRIITLPRTEKTIGGYSNVSLLVIDEASRVEDVLFYAVRSMLFVSKGTIAMLLTPYGKRGFFYEEWTGGHGWERYRMTADQVARISAEFLERSADPCPSTSLGRSTCAASRRPRTSCSPRT